MKKIIFLLTGFILLSVTTLPQIRSEELRFEAIQLMNSGRFGEAIDVLNRFISLNPQNVEGFLLRGTSYQKRGNFESAVYDFRIAQKLVPDDIEVNSKLTSVTDLWYKLLYNKIEGHKREIAMNPNRAINYLEIGISYKNLGEWKEAEIWYDEYLKRAEPSADEVLRYTEILAKNNQLSKGEQILKKYIVVFSGDHRVWSRYGYFLYWLGKNKLAINAFEEALKIRPFFKEALDGIDLAKGKGYIYTITDTTRRFTYGVSRSGAEYLIDKLSRIVRNNPGDDDSRFKLIDELVKAKRYEEAYENLKFLYDRYSEVEDFKLLYSRILDYRKAHNQKMIDEFEAILKRDPDNLKAMLNLAKYYSYLEDFKKSREYFERYLKLNPDDIETRYNYAQILTWSNELSDAKIQADYLLSKNPASLDYQLLRANIGFWLDEDLEVSENLFVEVLKKHPAEKTALFGMAYISLRKNNIDVAESYYEILKKDDSVSSKDLNELFNSIELNRKRVKEEYLYSILEEARRAISEKKCDEALYQFKRYYAEGGTDQRVKSELANAYQCTGDYDSAISIYDEMIRIGFDDFDILKQRAKMIFWSGDSLTALNEFRNLSDLDPDDAEVKLFLADTYFQLKQYRSARIIYNDLLKQSPESQIIQTRLKWLGSEGLTTFEAFPTYMMLNPQGSYFNDNTGFKYNLYGLGFELGATEFLSLGISGYRGSLLSDTSRLNFNNVKGSAFVKFNENVRLSASYGQTYFSNKRQENIIEVNLGISKKNIYNVNLFYNNMDASFILYSPFLVNNRLTSEFFGINGEYNFNRGFMISGKYSFINVSHSNEGNQLQVRFGKEFEGDFKVGYEYYYFSFNERSEQYWSPENFESHSVWTNIRLVSDDEINLSIGGKLGLIPENDYVLREFNSQFDYKIANNFILRAGFTAGSSSRAGIGYNSTSFQMSIFWSL